MTNLENRATIHLRYLDGEKKQPGMIIGAHEFTAKAAKFADIEGEIALLQELKGYLNDYPQRCGLIISDIVWQVQFFDRATNEQRVYEVDAIDL